MEFIDKDVFAVCGSSPNLVYILEIMRLDGSHSPHTIKLLHTVEISFSERSEIRRFPDVSRFVMLTLDKELKGLVIPHDKTVAPTVVELGRYKGDWLPRDCCALGVSASLFFDETNNTYEILTPEWNPPSSVISKHSTSTLDPPLRLPAMLSGFDQDTGRLLFPSRHGSFLFEII